jgi:uncharacterized OB-fold protein
MTLEFSELMPFKAYCEALARGALAYQHCEACARAVFQPRVNCPHCGGVRLQWRDSAGQGSVYSTTEVPGKDGSYNVVLVDLDEGFRMMSTVLGSQARIGQRVQGRVAAGVSPGDAPRVVFEELP